MPLHEKVFHPQIVNPNILRAESAEVPWRTKSQRERSSTTIARRVMQISPAESWDLQCACILALDLADLLLKCLE